MEEIQIVLFQKRKDMSQETKDFENLILTLVGMCNNDSQIVKKIKSMTAHLQTKLSDVTTFDKSVQKFLQNTISKRTQLQRDYEKKQQEMNNMNDEIDVLNGHLQLVSEELEKRIQEKDMAYIQLEALKKSNGKLQKSRDYVSYVKATVFAFYLVGKILKFFATEESNVDSFSIDFKTVEIFQNVENDFNSSCQNEVEEMKIKILNCSDLLKDLEKFLQKTDEEIESCNEYLKETLFWKSTINNWINFLIDMEPRAQRICNNLDNFCVRAFQSSINDFKVHLFESGSKLQHEAKINISASFISTIARFGGIVSPNLFLIEKYWLGLPYLVIVIIMSVNFVIFQINIPETKGSPMSDHMPDKSERLKMWNRRRPKMDNEKFNSSAETKLVN